MISLIDEVSQFPEESESKSDALLHDLAEMILMSVLEESEIDDEASEE